MRTNGASAPFCTLAMIITQQYPDQPDVIAMLEKLDAYFGELYPAESNHLMDVASLMHPSVVFLVARDEHGAAAGCGAYVDRGGYGEVKRMYVDTALRGRGTGARLLAEIIRRATQAGLSQLKLECGISQPEALSLYLRAGFTRCAPFGDYQLDPLSLFMGRSL